MSAPILAVVSDLRSARGAVDEHAAEARQAFRQTDARIHSLHGRFEGEAAETFDEKYTELSTAGHDLLKSLGSLGAFLEQAGLALQQIDSEITKGLVMEGAATRSQADRIKVEPDALAGLSNRLQGVATELDHAKAELNDDGSIHSSLIDDALGEFYGSWKVARGKLLEDVRNAANVVSTTASTFAGGDKELANALGTPAAPAVVTGTSGGGAAGGGGGGW